LNDTFLQYDTWNYNHTLASLSLFADNDSLAHYQSISKMNTTEQSYTQNQTFGQDIIVDSTNQYGRITWNGSCTTIFGLAGVMFIC